MDGRFGQRMSEASNKEEMLTYRQKLLDMKQEMLNLQQAFQQEQQSKNRLEELLRLKDDYFFNEEGVYSSWVRFSLQNCIFGKVAIEPPH